MTKCSFILPFILVCAPACTRGEEAAFKQAVAIRAWNFPSDHGSHAGYQTEWWYFTGNLSDDSGRAFGYQLTIFRRALHPLSPAQRGRGSQWALGDLYIGHLAVSDIGGGQFVFKEELKRGVLGVAGATEAALVAPASGRLAGGTPAVRGDGVRVWIGNWEIVRTDGGWTVQAHSGDIELKFTLADSIAPVLHGRPGEEGLSRKGSRPGQASYYYSMPGLETSGSLSIAGRQYKISGRSWMDHEFGSNQLYAEQAGWDWFSIQLDDGSALMLYLLRRKDGTLEPVSSGTWTDSSGTSSHLALSEIKTSASRVWSSPRSGAQYALAWKIEVPSRGVLLEVDAAQEDQEVRATKTARINYYEGALNASGTVRGTAVNGGGYLEITGANGQPGSDNGLGGRL